MKREELSKAIEKAVASDDPLAGLVEIARVNNYKPGWIRRMAEYHKINMKPRSK